MQSYFLLLTHTLPIATHPARAVHCCHWMKRLTGPSVRDSMPRNPFLSLGRLDFGQKDRVRPSHVIHFWTNHIACILSPASRCSNTCYPTPLSSQAFFIPRMKGLIDLNGRQCTLQQKRVFSCRTREPGYVTPLNGPPCAVRPHRQMARQRTSRPHG